MLREATDRTSNELQQIPLASHGDVGTLSTLLTVVVDDIFDNDFHPRGASFGRAAEREEAVQRSFLLEEVFLEMMGTQIHRSERERGREDEVEEELGDVLMLMLMLMLKQASVNHDQAQQQ